MGDILKKVFYLLLLIILLFPIKSLARYEIIDSRCTDSLKSSLKSDANDVTYRLSKEIKKNKVTYNAIFYNLTKDMYITDANNKKYTSNTISNLTPGSKIQVIIYASSNTYCEGYKIITKIISVPYYNKYYKNEICRGYENYYLCKENSNVNLTEEEFNKKMNEYIESLKVKETEEVKPEEDATKFDIISFILYYKYFFIGGISLIAITILIVVINNKRKNRGIL